MLQPATLRFIKGLTANNNKEWFDAHRDEYTAARKDMEALADTLRKNIAPLEPALNEQTGKETIFRIFRDVRFSKDKTPYKNHFGAYFSRGGRKWDGPGWYLHVAPGGSFIAGGLWMPQGALIKAARQEIDYSFEEFKSIIEGKTFRKKFSLIKGEELRSMPAGYTPDNPAAGYLKMKSYIASMPLSDETMTGKNAVKIITAAAKELHPLVAFFTRAMD